MGALVLWLPVGLSHGRPKLGGERSQSICTHSPTPDLVYCRSLPLDETLAEAELFPQYDSYRVDPLERLLLQAPVLTGSETLFPPLVPSGWGGNGFCCYYPGGLSVPRCFPQPRPPSVNSQLNKLPSGETLSVPCLLPPAPQP